MTLRERKVSKKVDKSETLPAGGKELSAKTGGSKQKIGQKDLNRQHMRFFFVKMAITAIAAFARFYNLDKPAEVVFDEVHFGKFASYYLEHSYFFDLHPPFAKLLIALVGWFKNYHGGFHFDNISVPYPSDVPYVAYRSLSAFQGTLVVPLVFSIMEQLDFSLAACAISSFVVALDNAQVLHSRLILLDSTLVLTMVLSLYCYIAFLKLWRTPFTKRWFGWLFLTGISLSSVMSTKFVGLFAFLTVGISVLYDLWRIADIRNGNTLRTVYRHFKWRSILLIIVPFLYFLFWFWVHFEVLTQSGPGDSFMSRRFQSTLADNPISKEALNVYYYDKVTIKSQANPSLFLHSHFATYPQQYPDGRISSQGQQVTGYPHEDINNVWQIIPEIELPEEQRGRIPLVGRQVVRLYHPSTDSFLLTHDVASPNYPAFMEFSTVKREDAINRFNDTLFQLKLTTDIFGQVVSKVSTFMVRSIPHDVYMYQSDKPLPDWGFDQAEINGPRQTTFGASQIWMIDDIIDLEDRDSRRPEVDEEKGQLHSMPFIYKYSELQTTMFRSNNNLLQEHPYNSWPKSWPLLRRGVSYWTQDSTKSQIYLMGNYFGWYLEVLALVMFVAMVIADQATQLRGVQLLSQHARRKLYTKVGWFFAAWLFHYAPFFTMHRQLFLHHYLPAHVIASFVLGGMADIVFMQQETPTSFLTLTKSMKIFTCVVFIGTTLVFFWVAPLTYGWPLSPAQVVARQIGNVALHFNK